MTEGAALDARTVGDAVTLADVLGPLRGGHVHRKVVPLGGRGDIPARKETQQQFGDQEKSPENSWHDFHTVKVIVDSIVDRSLIF